MAMGATALYFPYVGNVLGANEKIQVGCIGVGGKGDSDSADIARCGAQVVAICDVDQNTLDKKQKQEVEINKEKVKPFTEAKQYQDYRKMLEEMGSKIDAVTVSTPDHNHGTAAIRAMKLGKHCFCQKPLVQTVSEARTVRALARDKKLATQMGNQGSAENGLRRAVEVIHSGLIGAPKELHVWSNRPVWKQGYDRPAGEDPIPATLNWDCWLGPAAVRPFKKSVYHDFQWRGWYEFGTGALGDMACHTVNMPFRALKMGYPNKIECEIMSRQYPETFPLTSRIRYEFPERDGLPPLKFWWYDGNPGEANMVPLRPDAERAKEIISMMGKLPGSGALIIGEKGKVFSPDDYGAQFYVALKGEEDFVSGDKHAACKDIAQTIPRSPGHMQEFVDMIKDFNKPAYSNFEIAGYLAEVILLGCVALRVGEGRELEWDGPGMKSPNVPEAAQFTMRNNRKGWEA